MVRLFGALWCLTRVDGWSYHQEMGFDGSAMFFCFIASLLIDVCTVFWELHFVLSVYRCCFMPLIVRDYRYVHVRMVSSASRFRCDCTAMPDTRPRNLCFMKIPRSELIFSHERATLIDSFTEKSSRLLARAPHPRFFSRRTSGAERPSLVPPRLQPHLSIGRGQSRLFYGLGITISTIV